MYDDTEKIKMKEEEKCYNKKHCRIGRRTRSIEINQNLKSDMSEKLSYTIRNRNKNKDMRGKVLRA